MRPGQLRLRLPALSALHADAMVDWAWRERDAVVARGRHALRTLGERYPAAATVACVDVQDLILLELQLPRLSGRRLQVAMQGELEAMLLDDLAEVSFAHGPQDADGRVSVTWLGKASVQHVAAVLDACGVRLQGLFPTPLLLPLQPGRATLQECGDYLLVRTTRDRGWVQFQGSADRGRMLEQLQARLAGEGIEQVQWIGSPSEAMPVVANADVLPPQALWNGPLPAWSLPLPAVRRGAPRLAFGLGITALLLAALGVQLQSWQMARQGELLQQRMQRQLAEGFPEIGEVVDPVMQARRALNAQAVRPRQQAEVQRLAATAMQAVPELAGAATRMAYRPGVLQLQLAADAGLDEDPARRERWQAALQAQGLQLVARGPGALDIRSDGAR